MPMIDRKTCKTCGKIIPKKNNAFELCNEHLPDLPEKTKEAIVKAREKHDKIEEVALFDGKVVINVLNDKERQLLYSWVKDYRDLIFDTPDPYNDLATLLLYRLEKYRIDYRLAETGHEKPAFRKSLHESLNVCNNQIKATQDKLGITIEKMQKRKGSPEKMFPEMMKEFAKYRAENQHVFRGIAICPKCNDRIIFKSFLPTFEELSIQILKEISVTCQSVQDLIIRYEQYMRDMGTPGIYSEDIRRKIEETCTS